MTEKTMWRIPRLPREEYTEESQDVQAFWGEPDARENGSATNIIQVMANHPQLGKASNAWGWHILITNNLEPRERELIVLRVGWLTKSEYEWHNHVGYALNLGMSLEEIAAVKDGADSAWPFSDQDRAVLRGVDELMTTHDLSDESWADLAQYFNRRQLMDYLYTIGHYVMTAWATSAMRMPLEDATDQIGWDLKTKSGKTPRPTQKPGEGDDWADNRGYDNAAAED